MAASIENIIIGSIGVICTVLIIIAITVDIINRRKTKQAKRKHSDQKESKPGETKYGDCILLNMTNITLIVFLIHSASVAPIRLDVHPQSHSFCKYLTTINSVLYHTSRISLYAILICRVHVAFNGSCYEYNKKLIIYPLYVFVISFFIFAIVADIFFVDAYYDNDIGACVPHFALWGLLTSFAIDITMCIITLILFIRPLVKLNKIAQIENSIQMTDSPSSDLPESPEAMTQDISVTSVNSSTTKRDNSLGALILRYALLVIISIGSTLMFFGVVIMWKGMSDVTAPIDDAINVWCIILINKANKKIYKKLCYTCHGAMKTCCK